MKLLHSTSIIYSSIRQLIKVLHLTTTARFVLQQVRRGRVFLAQQKTFRQVTRDGVNYELDLMKIIDLEIYLDGWEPETISFLKRALDSNSIVIEAGANIGAHSLLIAKLVSPRGHVYSFEPTSYAFDKLLINCKVNKDLENSITIEKRLLTNHSLEIPNKEIISEFNINEKKSKAEVILDDNIAISIDDYILKKGIKKLDLLKIDVDGYDYKVLNGAKSAIKKFSPIVFIELANFTLIEQGDSVEDILLFLAKYGYTGYYINSGKIINSAKEVLSITGPTSHIDGIFLPIGYSDSNKKKLFSNLKT